MTTLRPFRASKIEGRRRLSCGSVELQTRQGQPSVGTPMEVPEPSTVIFSGALDILKELEKSTQVVEPRRASSARFGFGLCCRLSRHGLVDLHVRQLEFAEQVQE